MARYREFPLRENLLQASTLSPDINDLISAVLSDSHFGLCSLHGIDQTFIRPVANPSPQFTLRSDVDLPSKLYDQPYDIGPTFTRANS